MAWPAGQKIGNKPAREISGTELGIPAGGLAGLTSYTFPPVPWYAGGFARCHFWTSFTFNVAGKMQLTIEGLNSELTAPLGIFYEQLGPDNAGESFPNVFASGLDLSFDDGVWPGSYSPIQVTPQIPRGLALNPIWNKSAWLQFVLTSTGAQTFTLNSANFLLMGA
jgi:hypothetical protein